MDKKINYKYISNLRRSIDRFEQRILKCRADALQEGNQYLQFKAAGLLDKIGSFRTDLAMIKEELRGKKNEPSK